jgi:ATP-dependent exoDNAse (exonuclease V) alpha subunit
MLLQGALTPFREGALERRYGGRVFRVGDKGTQLHNNYDKGAAGVFNGTIGVVTAMSPEEHTLTVRTDEDESVDYGSTNWPTPTRSPSTVLRAANTPPWSSRSPPDRG